MMNKKTSFTLIELLIVVAIIGILAAIAVPNFLNAQLRAKLARVKNDLVTLSKAHEMYFLDNNSYPPESEDNIFVGYRPPHEAGLFFLTHPIPYISTLPHDPFQDSTEIRFGGKEAAYETGVASKGDRNVAYNIFSRGPDLVEDGLYSANPFTGVQRKGGYGNSYHSSNGLKSSGDIFYYGGDPSIVRSLKVDGKEYTGSFPPNFGG